MRWRGGRVGGAGCPPGPGEGAEPGRSRPGGQRPARLLPEERIPPHPRGQGAGHPSTGPGSPLSIFGTSAGRRQSRTRPGGGIVPLGTTLPREPVGGQTPRTEPTEGGPETAGEVLRGSGMTYSKRNRPRIKVRTLVPAWVEVAMALEAAGWTLSKRGWPHFLAVRGGEVRLIVCGRMRERQAVVARALSRLGVTVEVLSSENRAAWTDGAASPAPPVAADEG
jgi:hypothetical protein